MKKDRIIRKALDITYDAIADDKDPVFLNRSKEKVVDVIESIIDFQIDAINQDMLRGKTRVIIPRIGRFTKNPNKAIIRAIRADVLREMGFTSFADIPNELRQTYKQRVNDLSLMEFSRRKRERQKEIADSVQQLKNDLLL